LVAVAIDNIKAKKTEQMLIGTDTNQSIAFPQDKNMFFSSIEKKVAMAVYKTIVMLAGIPLDFVDATISDVNFQGDFVELKTSAYVKYGFDKGFVGYSKSTLAGENSAKADLCLKEAHELFKKLDLNNYFKPMTDPTKNQVILDTIIKGINS
jgi:basic membrane lipoprotein Med (substrate-binding protein (PBP1-ABC) superfamily)